MQNGLKLPIVVPNVNQQPQIPNRTIAQPNQTPQNIHAHGQGQHQVLFNQPGMIAKKAPPQQGGLIAGNNSVVVNDEGGDGDFEVQSPNVSGMDPNITPVAASKKTTKKTVSRRKAETKEPKEPKETKSKKSTKSESSNPRDMSRIAMEVAKDFKIEAFISKRDNKGIMWMEKLPDDDAPKRLNQIPTDPKHNEVEFTRWQEYNGKTSIGMLLYTIRGVKYWADSGSIRWLQNAKNDGFVPGRCTFIVKNTKTEGLQYGFRALDPTLLAQQQQQKGNQSPSSDEDDDE